MEKMTENKMEACFLTGVIQGLLWIVEWELGLRAGNEAVVCTGLNHSEGGFGVHGAIALLGAITLVIIQASTSQQTCKFICEGPPKKDSPPGRRLCSNKKTQSKPALSCVIDRSVFEVMAPGRADTVPNIYDTQIGITILDVSCQECLFWWPNRVRVCSSK